MNRFKVLRASAVRPPFQISTVSFVLSEMSLVMIRGLKGHTHSMLSSS